MEARAVMEARDKAALMESAAILLVIMHLVGIMTVQQVRLEVLRLEVLRLEVVLLEVLPEMVREEGPTARVTIPQI
jgi:hypothetical protein